MGNYVIGRLFVTFSDIFGSFLGFIIPCIIIAFVAPGIGDLGKESGKLLAITGLIAYLSTIVAGTIAYFIGISILPKVIKVGQLAPKSNIRGNTLQKSIKDFQDIVSLVVQYILIPFVPVYIVGIFIKLTAAATIHLAGDTITLVLASMGVMLINGQIPTFQTMMPFILMLGVTMVAAPGIPGDGAIAIIVDAISKKEERAVNLKVQEFQ